MNLSAYGVVAVQDTKDSRPMLVLQCEYCTQEFDPRGNNAPYGFTLSELLASANRHASYHRRPEDNYTDWTRSTAPPTRLVTVAIDEEGNGFWKDEG